MRTYTRKKLQVQEIENVESLCRLCLGKTEKMTSIFDGNIDDVFCGLPMRIGMCLGLEVSRDDALPKLICQVCHGELDKFYTFKKNCAATYWKLKATVLAVKNPNKRNGDDESNQKISLHAFVLDNDEKLNDGAVIDPIQRLQQNEMTLGIPCNEFSLKEENLTHENIMLDDNERNSTIVSASREKENCLMTAISDEGATSKKENLQMAECEVEQDLRKDDQFNESNNSLHIVQDQEDEKAEKSNNIKTTECLPTYIITSLIESRMLAKRDEALEILDQNMKTFNLETACGSEILMELVEEEPEMLTAGCYTSLRPKILDSNCKNEGSARCCGTCGMRFSSRGALVRHLRVHSGEKPFPCRTCGRRFSQREVLRRHELLHSDKLPYQCAWCPKAYTQRGALEAHARSHASPAARPLVLHRCSRCPKVFLYPSGLSRHMSIHQGRDFPCDECLRTFNDKSSLQRHRRAHQRARAR